MEIMYHVSYWFSSPPPSFFCLSGCYSFLPSFLPSFPPLSLSLSRICILRIRCVCAIAAAAAAIEEVLIKMKFIFGCNSQRGRQTRTGLGVCPRASRVALKQPRPPRPSITTSQPFSRIFFFPLRGLLGKNRNGKHVETRRRTVVFRS
jgi:hypothetical protein